MGFPPNLYSYGAQPVSYNEQINGALRFWDVKGVRKGAGCLISWGWDLVYLKT